MVFIAELHVTSDEVLNVWLDDNHEELVKEQIPLQSGVNILELVIVSIKISDYLENNKNNNLQRVHYEENV